MGRRGDKRLTKSQTTFVFKYFLSLGYFRWGPIASRDGGSQMRQNITRVLSDRLLLRTYQEYFMNSSGYILNVMNFISQI